MSGADLIVKTLEGLRIEVIFAIPGSNDAHLYNALRQSSIRTVLATNELHAAFMANGYFRNSGKVGVVLTIAGPGFTNAITGLVEAFFDSVGMLCIICKPSNLPGRKFQLQKIDEKDLVRNVTKGCFSLKAGSDTEKTLSECIELATTGEPGPVLLEVMSDVLSENTVLSGNNDAQSKSGLSPVDEKSIAEAIELIVSSHRAVLYLGQGAISSSTQISDFIKLLKTPVLTTTSGRGIVPESHPMSLPSDLVDDVDSVNGILDSCDLIVAMGCKFTHNGAKGFRLNIPEEKLIHVDASPEVLGANYPAHLAISTDVSEFLSALLNRREAFESRKAGWEAGEIDKWRQSLIKSIHKKTYPEPHFEGMSPPTARAFFSALQNILPGNSCVLTDSGLHQMLARQYLEVSVPRGLIVPSDFQSMGFGIPAGIGARLADPARHVVVVVGDGGFALSGMELSTAVRENIAITVILFNDNNMGLIRLHQLSKLGHSHAVKTSEIDYSKFCESMGVQYFKLNNNLQEVISKSLDNDCVSLVEVVLKDSLDIQKTSVKGLLRNILKI